MSWHFVVSSHCVLSIKTSEREREIGKEDRCKNLSSVKRWVVMIPKAGRARGRRMTVVRDTKMYGGGEDQSELVKE